MQTGCKINVHKIVYQPPRDGPTLWEIGIPDRSAAEFFVPEPNPKFINKVFVNHPDRLSTYLYVLALLFVSSRVEYGMIN